MYSGKIFYIKLIPFLLISLAFPLISCQSSYNSNSKSYSSHSYISVKQPGIQLGACQAGLSNTDEEFMFMENMGIEWLRGSIPWSRVEKAPGVWNFDYYDRYMELADKYNKKVLIVLDYDVPWIHGENDRGRRIPAEMLPHFLNYVKTIALRYGKQAAGFEIWNEPNNKIFWKGSDADFFELTLQSTRLLKQLLPDKPVAVGSILYNPIFGGESFLKKLIKTGIFNYADAVSLHPYGISPTASARRVEKAEQIIRKAGYNKEIWITEIGYPTGGFYLTSKSMVNQAESLIKVIVQLSAAGADIITWFKLFDDQLPDNVHKGSSSEKFFGLAYPDFSLKPSGLSYSLLSKGLQGSLYISNGIKQDFISDRYIESYRFDHADGIVNIIIWSNGAVNPITITGLNQTFTITNLITGGEFFPDSENYIQIGPDPVLIKGELLNPEGQMEIIGK